MKIVFIVFVLLGIFIAALSILPESVTNYKKEETPNLNLKPIKGLEEKEEKSNLKIKPIKNEIDVYEKLGVKDIKDKVDKNINTLEKEGLNGLETVKNDLTTETKDIEFKMLNWELKGQQKNILVISFEAKNNTKEILKNVKKTILCNTDNGTNKSNIKKEIILNIKEKEKITITDETIDYVDFDISNVECILINQKDNKLNLSISLNKKDNKDDVFLPPIE